MITFSKKVSLISSCLTAVFFISPASASTPDVCPSGCAYSSIQTAIDAIGGGRITVGAGTYYEAITVWGPTLELVSTSGAENTTIDASGLGKVAVNFNAPLLDGFTIKGGNSSNGGGILVGGYGPKTIRNNIFKNNNSSWGGGAQVNGSQALFEDNIFENNNGTRGGAVLVNTEVVMDRNIFRNNTSGYGGAVFFRQYSDGEIKNCLMDGNHANYHGGAVYNDTNYQPYIYNCTVVNNTADNGGFSGIYTYLPRSPATVRNVISWNNGPAINANVSYSLEGIDPLFVDEAGGDYRLQSGSPAIDAGGATATVVDLDGNARPIDGDGLGAGSTGDGSDYDIGAYEAAPAADVCPVGCAYSSIQAAINAIGGGRITVGAGTYYEAITVWGPTLELVSTSGAENTTIDASGLGKVAVNFNAPLLDGFTIKGGNSSNGGGIIVGGYGPKIIRNNIFRNNNSSWGGGAQVNGSQALFEDNIFENNNGTRGGAVLVNTEVVMDRNIFRNNTSGYGGAVFFRQYSDGEIKNCLMDGNHANYHGGALYIDTNYQPYIYNCTVVNNTADNGGFSGIYTHLSRPPATVRNVISWNNNPAINANVSYSLEGIDPLFVDEAGGDYRLQSGSPAIDAGGATATVVDLDGNARPNDGDGLGAGGTGDGSDYDIGAYEF